MRRFESTPGYEIVENWMKASSRTPFSFQRETWKKFDEGYSGIVVAPTGFGKTFSVFLALLIHYLNNPQAYSAGVKLLWITPLRSLAKDLARAMQTALQEMGLDWEVGVRNGDTTPAERQQQKEKCRMYW